MAEQRLIEERHVMIEEEKRVGYAIEEPGIDVITRQPRAELVQKWKLP